jgi:putative membrane protein
MKKVMLMGGLLSVIVMGSCGKSDADDVILNATDQTFMVGVNNSNLSEVQAGQLASTKATNPSVKAYGQSMVTEHTAAQAELTKIAADLRVDLPSSVDAEQRAILQYLSSLNGYTFDTAYMSSQVKGHQKTLAIFQTELASGSHPQVRNYASAKVGHIQMHLDSAVRIRVRL